MKIRMGGRTFTGPTSMNLLEQEIVAGLNNRFVGDSFRLTRPGFMKLIDRIRLAAEVEAMRIFPTAARVVEASTAGTFRIREGERWGRKAWDKWRERPGFDDSQLGGPTQFLTNTAIPRQGGVNWVDLTPRWVKRKTRAGSRGARKFFWFRGTLKGQLNNPVNSASWITKAGGVKVKVTQDIRGLKPKRKTKLDRDWVIGAIDIEIFPNLSSAMLPMLASRRWDDTNQGGLDRYLFSGTMRDKLVGPPDRHRPLVQPIMQFWMAFRIPQAIRRAIQLELNR